MIQSFLPLLLYIPPIPLWIAFLIMGVAEVIFFFFLLRDRDKK